MNKKLFYLLLASFSLIAPLYAQEEQEEIEESAPYIGSFGNKFSLRLLAYRSDLDLTRTYINNVEEDYLSNTPLIAGLGFTYKNFGIELTRRTPFFYDSGHSKTRAQEGRFNCYTKSMTFEIQVKDYKGFYTDSDKETDLHLRCAGIFVQYIWNSEKYSWRAAFDLHERQLRSAGSLFFGGSVFYMMSKDRLAQPYKKSHILAVPDAGYAYTWVYKNNLFLALALSAGLGITHELNDAKTHPAVSLSFHGAAGYHWGDISFMISAKALVFAIPLGKQKDDYDQFTNSTLQCSAAKRF